METLDIGLSDINDLFIEIGLADPKGAEYGERLKKRDQVFDYAAVFDAALKKLSKKRTLTLLDCACGRSYLSFYLNHTLAAAGRSNLRFIGVDTNRDLIEKCRRAASALEYSNMEFYCGEIKECRAAEKTDVVYSLHACDTAT
ncbi:MAG: methyltransferase, partial [Syntrophorhabdaceae bacterium]|nr:methyltransferase [Syntrophorhabdaceae bacterium]